MQMTASGVSALYGVNRQAVISKADLLRQLETGGGNALQASLNFVNAQVHALILDARRSVLELFFLGVFCNKLMSRERAELCIGRMAALETRWHTAVLAGG